MPKKETKAASDLSLSIGNFKFSGAARTRTEKRKVGWFKESKNE
jgi:hypothetical protein